jgi:hypothetical protein
VEKWKEEQGKIDEVNRKAVELHEKELGVWKVESVQARAEHRQPRWLKPIKPKKIPQLPKT